MKTIPIKVFNEMFNNKNKYFVSEERGHTGVLANNYDGVQGEYNEYHRYYRHPDMDQSLFLRLTYHTDSYGGNDFLSSVNFVEGREKTITIFEPV